MREFPEFLHGMTVGEFRVFSEANFREALLDRANPDAILVHADHLEALAKAHPKFSILFNRRATAWRTRVDEM